MSEAETKQETKQEKIRRQTNIRVSNYYQRNKEKILEQNKQLVNCELCGRRMTKGCLSKHRKSEACKNAHEFLRATYNIETR